MAESHGAILRPAVETRSRAAQYDLDRVRFRRQIHTLWARSPFHRAKLEAAGFATPEAADDLDAIAALPFTEKDEIRRTQAEHPPLGAHLTAAPESLIRIYSTSGTTGEPCYMPLTRADLDGWIEISSRAYYAAGIRPGMRVLGTYNAGPFVAGAVSDTLTSLGVCLIPTGSGNTAKLVRALQVLRPKALLCTPSYAVYLAEHLHAQGIRPDSLGLARVGVAGEPGGGEPALRQSLEAAFGAKVCETMGIGDISISLWGECDHQAGMHFGGSDYVHVELIDPDTRAPVPLEDGATGELVYTALTREAAPTLRFRSRDHVVCWTSPCACGRTTLRVRCIGRTDDLLIVRGVNVFPSAVRAVVAGFAPAVSGVVMLRPRRHGVRQEPPLPVDVELGPDGTASPALIEAIEHAIRQTLTATARVTLVPFGSLPRSDYKTRLIDFSQAE